MNSFVITELKELDDKSYEEIGTVGDDSKSVIWSSSSWGQYLFLSTLDKSLMCY
jgi:hypothetical protein